ncbi:MAG: flagellar biosynthetic protein FliO [Deltaproteobacteria bacterium]|nr:flagellar biosynthetic protein FliO [Deltaproteobacteria bacterium]MBW2078701.1 flagellar biosynthetic protein FliO [Deltaproteobacteria bacterium]
MAGRLFLVLLMFPTELLAGTREPMNLFQSGMKLLMALALVVGIMLLIHAVGQKGFKLLEKRGGGRIRLLESRAMGGRKSLCLVEVEGERLLLGLGNDRIDLLHRYDAGEGSGQFENELRSRGEEAS